MMSPSSTTILRAAAALLLTAALVPAAFAREAPEPYRFCDAWLTEAPKIDPAFLQAVPGRDGWLLAVTEISGLTSVPDETSLLLLQQFVQALQKRGTRLVIVVPPPRGLLASGMIPPQLRRYADTSDDDKRKAYRAALAALARSGAIVPDILAAVEQGLPSPDLYYRRQDIHWRAEGAELTAKTVAAAIEQAVDMAAIPRKRFVSRAMAPQSYGDRTVSMIEKICGARMARELTPTYLTEAVEGGEGEGDGGGLLGESSQPVVLAGTSFSRPDAPAYNFGGFLAQHLSVDLLNVAIPGGGLSMSMLSYLGSMDYQDAPPAVLVWEVRPHDLPDETMLRRALATIQGECEDGGAVLAGSAELKRGATTLLTLSPEQRRQMSQPLYLDVSVGETGLNKFRLRFEYTDFSREDVSVDLSRATVAAGHYYYSLPPERLRKLESVSLRPAARLHGQVSAAFCPINRVSPA